MLKILLYIPSRYIIWDKNKNQMFTIQLWTKNCFSFFPFKLIWKHKTQQRLNKIRIKMCKTRLKKTLFVENAQIVGLCSSYGTRPLGKDKGKKFLLKTSLIRRHHLSPVSAAPSQTFMSVRRCSSLETSYLPSAELQASTCMMIGLLCTHAGSQETGLRVFHLYLQLMSLHCLVQHFIWSSASFRSFRIPDHLPLHWITILIPISFVRVWQIKPQNSITHRMTEKIK